MAMAILLPEIVQAGMYYIAQTPLYAINEKNNFVPLWTAADITKAKDDKKSLIRIKGLGEMNPDQLKVVLINEKTRRLIPVTYTSDLDKMVKLFSDSNEKRKLLDGTWII
jgi:DNA gyrase/topoisomerase IV subunit B